ncbi:arabinogalactan protein 16-like [Primulina huaijiensis]|uniref:arabinogalactan protein 16-like n=1 Tax=Primulina huaijiensis TaxID=1492673 RepID=UPI003CC70D46
MARIASDSISICPRQQKQSWKVLSWSEDQTIFLMAMAWFHLGLMAIFAFPYDNVITFSRAQDLAPAPGPSSDGNAIDQGIACVLMLVALVLTYLIQPMDTSSSFSFS